MTRRTGRRPGDVDTRGEILEAARELFARDGYDRTSLRAIAREAGVDPALVHHYFAGKDEVFTAALELPITPVALVADVLDGEPEQLGERLARTFLTVWSGPAGPRFVALLRSATSSEQAARMLREFLTATILEGVAQRLDHDQPRLRATLCAAQLVGVGLLRHVLRFPALVEADPEELVSWLAPTLQRYLTAADPGVGGDGQAR